MEERLIVGQDGKSRHVQSQVVSGRSIPGRNRDYPVDFPLKSGFALTCARERQEERRSGLPGGIVFAYREGIPTCEYC